jgi:hypothetical protein
MTSTFSASASGSRWSSSSFSNAKGMGFGGKSGRFAATSAAGHFVTKAEQVEGMDRVSWWAACVCVCVCVCHLSLSLSLYLSLSISLSISISLSFPMLVTHTGLPLFGFQSHLVL